MSSYRNPMTQLDGFDWTEDFDSVFKNSNKFDTEITYYVNLKMACDKGGAQTRSLREVSHFINAQYNILPTIQNTVFINILDGDASYTYSPLFGNIKIRYNNVPGVFIGNMLEFQAWWSSIDR
jgi:hypothetical protein